jgi:hypothetical protein
MLRNQLHPTTNIKNGITTKNENFTGTADRRENRHWKMLRNRVPGGLLCPPGNKIQDEKKMPCGVITGARTKVTRSGGILNRKALLNNKTGGRPTQICRSENQAPDSNDEEKNLA